MTIEYKTCSLCLTKLPATTDYFHKDNQMPDGLHSQCKKCRLQARKKYYIEQRDMGVTQKYYRDNRLKYIARSMNNRCDIKVTYTDIKKRIDSFLDTKGNLHCVYCSRTIYDDDMLHIEHFIPISKGGTNSIENIIPVCRYCNRSKAGEDFLHWYRNQLFYSKEHETYVLNLMNFNK